jgi:hypothetical protein
MLFCSEVCVSKSDNTLSYVIKLHNQHQHDFKRCHIPRQPACHRYAFFDLKFKNSLHIQRAIDRTEVCPPYYPKTTFANITLDISIALNPQYPHAISRQPDHRTTHAYRLQHPVHAPHRFPPIYQRAPTTVAAQTPPALTRTTKHSPKPPPSKPPYHPSTLTSPPPATWTAWKPCS